MTVTVGASGKFTVRLAAGTYSALLAPASLTPVREHVRVEANQTLTITILCSWTPVVAARPTLPNRPVPGQRVATEARRKDSNPCTAFDPSRPNIARVYAYLLGGYFRQIQASGRLA